MKAIIATLSILTVCSAHCATDEEEIARVVEAFRVGAEKQIRAQLADVYIHVTPTGMMTNDWRFVTSEELRRPNVEKLHLKVWEGVAVASYFWRLDQDGRTSVVMQAFQRQQAGWRLIATQVGGANLVYTGPITAKSIVPPTNPAGLEDEVRQAWQVFLEINLRTPSGDTATNIDKLKSIVAEDCAYISPDGSVINLAERIAIGHRGVKQLRGEEVRGSIVVPAKHVDEQLAVFGNVAVWTSRNDAGGNQAFRVWLKRPIGWQIMADRQGMSYRKK
jgi:hypothetical protein